MSFAKSCPGSRSIREPIPEYVRCSNCGQELEIWTDELRVTCRNCGTRVFREQQPSCIDWCPHAKECVGPEVYERLRGEPEMVELGEVTPLDILKHEHDKAQELLSMLKASSLCIRVGTASAQSTVREKGIINLDKVLDFFDKELRAHFQHEEEILFPVLDKRIGQEKSPTQMLLKEHSELWQNYDLLKQEVAELSINGTGQPAAVAVYETAGQIVNFLLEHIRKENEALLPLAKRLLDEEEQKEIARQWQVTSRV